MQGWRLDMEDAHISEPLPGLKGHYIFGVFDGHAGDQTAKLSAQHLLDILSQEEKYQEYLANQSNTASLEQALTNAFINFDKKIYNEDSHSNSGCTSCVVVVTPTKFICANAGDSRSIVGDKSAVDTFYPLSFDHKPSDDLESKRITNAGGFVNYGRVDGELAVSRAFGDFRYKDMTLDHNSTKVICVPDINVIERTKNNDFLIIACDGLWDVYSNENAIKEVREKYSQFEQPVVLEEGAESVLLNEEQKLRKLVEHMLDSSLNLGSKDNISCIVIKFKN